MYFIYICDIFSVSQSRGGTLFLGSVIVPIFCETSGEREVSVNPSPGAWRHKTQTETVRVLYTDVWSSVILWHGLVLCVGRCVTLSKYWAEIRLINVLFAIFYIFIHFIEFQIRFIDLDIFCFFDQILACLVLEIIATWKCKVKRTYSRGPIFYCWTLHILLLNSRIWCFVRKLWELETGGRFYLKKRPGVQFRQFEM